MSRVGGAVGAEVVADRPLGAYRQLSLALPSTGVSARAGQFVVVPPADPRSVLPRSWWVCGAGDDPDYGSTLEVVVEESEPTPAVGEHLPVLGLLGRALAAPTPAVPAVVVGHEGGGAVARWWGARLRERGCAVHLVLVATDPDRQVDVVGARRTADTVLLTDEPGAPAAVEAAVTGHAAAVLYAVTPLRLSATLAAVAQRWGLPSQLTAFEAGRTDRCGTGLCGGCDLETAASPRHRVRPCVDGPAVRGDLVRWAATGDRS